MKKRFRLICIAGMIVALIACGSEKDKDLKETDTVVEEEYAVEEDTDTENEVEPEEVEEPVVESEEGNIFEGYTVIEVDGGNQSGYREPNVAVDIGFGDREYWAFTNEYGQLVKVVATEIILQDDYTEPVTSQGRYYSDEAKVPGVERDDLDEGHIIADSLGGVSNAYNITPQNSTMNRYGDQAYMEKNIRDAGGCTDFVAVITYPDTSTQIPSHYSYTYTLMGNVINEEFDNIDPDTTYGDYSSSSSSSGYTESSGTTQDTTSNGSIVYWTPNGKSYHTTPNCPTLSRSKTILEGTLEESGKTDPCDRCH